MSETGQTDARRRLTEAELRERALELSKPITLSDLSAAKVVGYLGIRIDEEWFCVPVSLVREVLYRPRLSRVPFMAGFVSGLFNLRGVVMGLINLATLFEIGGNKNSNKGWDFAVLIHDTDSDTVAAGLLADEVCEVLPVGNVSHDRIPSTIPPNRAQFFSETFRFEETTYTVLNLENILSLPELRPIAVGERS